MHYFETNSAGQSLLYMYRQFMNPDTYTIAKLQVFQCQAKGNIPALILSPQILSDQTIPSVHCYFSNVYGSQLSVDFIAVTVGEAASCRTSICRTLIIRRTCSCVCECYLTRELAYNIMQFREKIGSYCIQGQRRLVISQLALNAQVFP